jgi:hypothetical protein
MVQPGVPRGCTASEDPQRRKAAQTSLECRTAESIQGKESTRYKTYQQPTANKPLTDVKMASLDYPPYPDVLAMSAAGVMIEKNDLHVSHITISYIAQLGSSTGTARRIRHPGPR